MSPKIIANYKKTAFQIEKKSLIDKSLKKLFVNLLKKITIPIKMWSKIMTII